MSLIKPYPIASLLTHGLSEVRVAHRGASEQAPENTMAAFDLAAAMGAQMIELDVHLTADDQVIVMHDESVNRTTNGHGSIDSLTWEQIQTLDAGSWKDPKFVGTTVPRIEDVLAWRPDNLFLNIELKGTPHTREKLVKAVLQKIQDEQALPWTMLSSFDHEMLSLARHLHSDITLGAIFYGRLWPRMDLAQQLNLASLHAHVSTIDTEWVSSIQNAGIGIMAWTVTDHKEVQTCRDAGVRAIVVNDLHLLQTDPS